MSDRDDIFEERLRLLREEKMEPAAFLSRFTEYIGIVPVVGERRGTTFTPAMLQGQRPEEVFFPIFSSRDRYASSFLAPTHKSVELPLDTLVRQIRLDTGITINPGTDFTYNFSPFTLQRHIRAFGVDTVLEEVTEDWLSALNDQFSRDGVAHGQRTWRAMAEWSSRNKTALAMDSWRADSITSWFGSRIKPGSDHIGLLAKAAYYYDATFWTVELPVIFGLPGANPGDFLAMPASIRRRLFTEPNELYLYLKFWADCVDYFYGINDIRDPDALNNPLLHGFILASREHLKTAALLLLEQRPNSKAAESAALALEIILKAFLVAKLGIDEEAIKKAYRHNLEKLLKACVELDSEFNFIRLFRRICGSF